MAVEFEADNSRVGRLQPLTQNQKMVKFLIDKGIVKDEKQAFYVLLGITVTCFLISVYFWARVIEFPVKPSAEPVEQQQEFEQQTP